MLKQLKKLIMGKEETVMDVPLVEENLEQIKATSSDKKQIKEELANSETNSKDFLYYSAEAVGYPNREDQWNTYGVVLAYIPSGDSILDLYWAINWPLSADTSFTFPYTFSKSSPNSAFRLRAT